MSRGMMAPPRWWQHHFARALRGRRGSASLVAVMPGARQARASRVLHATLAAATALAWAACASSRGVPAPVTQVPATAPAAVASPEPGAPEPLTRLRLDLLQATRSSGVQRGTWGVLVRSLDRDEVLFELNPQALLVPASIAKIVSVAAAADAVGWDFRYTTTLRATGPITDGVLDGDLIVAGTGDPSIGGRDGTSLKTFVEALQQRGVRRISGRVIGDDNAIEEPRPALAWAWDDLGYPTGVLFGALNAYENRLTVTVRPGGVEGAPAALHVESLGAARPLGNRVMTGAPGSPQQLWPEQRPGEPFLTIAGSIPAGGNPGALSVSAGNPTAWFASVLRYELLRGGIDVVGDAWDIDDVIPQPRSEDGEVLHVQRSPTLGELTVPLLRHSINLYGEAVMRLNAAPGALQTNDAALDGLRARLAGWGIDLAGQQIIDGSGLSRRDVIAADTMMKVLRRVYDPDWNSPLLKGLPVAGVDGSLAARMRATPAESNVRAKTGTMSNIRSLAGYATTRDGERLAFVIMLNNFEGTGTAATEAVDAIAIRLAGFSRMP